MQKEKENNIFDIDLLFKKAWEKQFISIYVDEVPKMLNEYKIVNKDILELKRKIEKLDSYIIEVNSRIIKKDYIDKIESYIIKIDNKIENIKESGCDPINQHYKMHKFVYWVMSLIATVFGFFVMWYFGR